MICKAYQHRLEELEDYVQGRLDAAPAGELQAHLAVCVECRETLQMAAASGPWLRAGREATPAPGGVFWTRLGALLRAEEEKRSRRREFTGAMEWLAWRTATAALLAVVLLGGYAITHPPVPPTAENRGGVFQEPEHPGSEDEVLVTLATRQNGR